MAARRTTSRRSAEARFVSPVVTVPPRDRNAMGTRIARIAGQHDRVLQFHREPIRAPHLVVLEGGSVRDVEMDSIRRRLRRSPVLLVLLATVAAVAVDLVDGVPAWSHWAALGTALVLGAHALITRLRCR
jgi:hypothetical protein